MSLMRMLSPVLGGPSASRGRETKDIKLRVRQLSLPDISGLADSIAYSA
jgi:hypothetical protein